MCSVSHDQPISVEDDLNRERDANRKHEFAEGVVHAVVGATKVVNRGTDRGFDRATDLGLDAVIPLLEIECSIRLSDLYENVDFPPLPMDGDQYDAAV